MLSLTPTLITCLESERDLAYIQKLLGQQSMQFLVRYTQMPEEQKVEMLDTIELDKLIKTLINFIGFS